MQKMIQELLQMMEKDTAINAAKELCSKEIHPTSKLYSIYNGKIIDAIEGIDNITVLKLIASNLRNLRKQIDNAIMDVKGTCEAKIQALENADKRFQDMSREDMIARIKELEAREENS